MNALYVASIQCGWDDGTRNGGLCEEVGQAPCTEMGLPIFARNILSIHASEHHMHMVNPQNSVWFVNAGP